MPRCVLTGTTFGEATRGNKPNLGPQSTRAGCSNAGYDTEFAAEIFAEDVGRVLRCV